MNRKMFASAIFSVVLLGTGALWAQQPKPAQAAGLKTEDYVEIQQLYARYAHALDAFEREGAGWAETFTADGIFNKTTIGYDALVQFAKTWRSDRGGAFLQHWNNQLVITPTAGGARGSAYMMLVDRHTQPPSIRQVYEYDDELVRTNAGWRFKSRSFVQLPAPPAAK